MTRSQTLALFALVMVVPAVAVGAGSFFVEPDAACYSTDTIGYRLIERGAADYTVRIDNAAPRPDVALQIVDDPAIADFVLADGAETLGGCDNARGIRTIRLDARADDPDLTIAVQRAPAAATYRIYAGSPDVTPQQAAALFAVMLQAGRKSAYFRTLAAREDVTGALTPPSPRSLHAARQ
jgi:hypothetical protein